MPSVSNPPSRRASLVDFSSTLPTPENVAATASASLVQLLTTLAESTKPKSAALHGMKRKFETEPALSPFRKASAADIHLPSDPTRRASIINLATAAAAAVLQSQAAQERRMSTVPEHETKRQRVQQLDLLYEQARNASTSTLSEANTPQPEAVPSDTPTPKLASTLGITPKGSPRSGALSNPSTPQKQHTSSTLTAEASDSTLPSTPQATSPLATRPKLASFAASSSSSPVLGSSSQTPQPADDSEALLQDVKEATDQFSRFYQFESRWAKKALELEQRRASVRIDPLSNPYPQPLAPIAADANASKTSSPSRITSRGASPSLFPAALTSSAAKAPSFTAVRGSSVGGLATVLSDFAELIEHRQRSCSGLEALAKQAKELPKRLSQPNPQFRTTFDDFSWSRRSQTPMSSSAMSRASGSNQAISETPVETEADASKVSPSMSRRQSKVKVEDKSGESSLAASEPDVQPATPRSSMSIASML